MLIMNLYQRPEFFLEPTTVDFLFFTFLGPFVVYALLSRFSVWRKKRSPNALPLLTVLGLTASGFFLWVLT